MPNKIALVAQNISPLGSHASAAMRTQAERMSAVAAAMARHGHRVTIFARLDSPGRARRSVLAGGVTVRHLAAGPPADLSSDEAADHIAQFASRLAEAWRRATPDVTYAYYWTSGLAALAAGRDLGVPVVQTFGSLGSAERRHDMPGSGPAGRVRLEASIAKSVRTILATSTDEVTELARLGVPRQTIRVVPVGVDPDVFADQGRAARRSGRPRLIAIGTFGGRNGLDTVIKALAHVPRAELVIAGGPADDDLGADPGYLLLDQLACAVGVRDRVSFVGKMAPKRLAIWLRSADLAVTAADYDPFGLVAIQAMACGVPVIASAVGGNCDAIVDGTTGALIQPGQPEALGRRIRELLAAPARLAAYGVAGADRARVRYSWDRIGRETLAACGVGEPPARPAWTDLDHDLDSYEQAEDLLATA